MKATILDTTLRDGSYAIDFKFTSQDTATIASKLEAAGVELIEIGHGIGLGASSKGYGVAAETDEDYLKAAASTLSRAKFGMFCIPGIASLEDVDKAADLGASFIRIGTNVTEVAQAKPYIERAKKHNLYVAANFMKSYAISPEKFAELAKRAKGYGADALYIVDSSGGMILSELKDYVEATQLSCDIPIGFHGHNNLGLAVAHSLSAIEMGAVLVDSSLQGLGRSAGNAATELLVAALHRMGVETGIDLLEIMNIGEKYIKPLLQSPGFSSLDVVTGYAQFHSSYMGTIHKFASKYNIDPRTLIIELCKVDKINAPDDLVESIAARVQKTTSQPQTSRFDLASYHGDEQR